MVNRNRITGIKNKSAIERIMLYKQIRGKSRHWIVFGLLSLLILAPAFVRAQQPDAKEPASEDQTRRKFDYYFYEALNAKTQGNYAEALDLFLHCQALDSTNANVLIELGTFYNALSEKNKALDYFRKAVQYDPSNYYYTMTLAGLSKELGLKKEVIGIYNSLLKQYPDKINLYFELANAYADDGELEKAMEALNAFEKGSGFSEMVALNKFRLYSMMNQKEKAFREIKNIIDKAPNDPRYLLLMGDLYLQDNQNDKALEYYEQVRAVDPDYPALILSMVNYYETTENKEAAQAELQKAITGSSLEVEVKIELLTRYISLLQQNKQDIKQTNPLFKTLFEQYPNNSQLNLIYGNVLMMQEDKKGATKQFEIYIKDNPDDPAGYEQLLRIALSDNDMDKVIKITTEAIRQVPQHPQFHFYLGGAYYQQKKYREALAVFEKGLETATFENPLLESDFLAQVGDLNHLLGNTEAAFENYEKALKLNPQNLPVLNNYSYYLSLQKRDLDKAEQMSGITIKGEPTNATYLDTYGWILFEQGSYVAAKIYIEKAIEYGSKEPSAEVYEHYGDVLYMTGDALKAVEQWKTAKKLGSDSKTLDQKIKTGKYIEKDPQKK
jgi:tetratricopeptide (TPR) repeat protein